MTTTERENVPPIVCTPWCGRGDGHPNEYFTSDQSCVGVRHRVPLSLRDATGELSVMPWRNNGKRPDVLVNVGVEDIDVDVHLTPAQARLLAESLLSVAETVEATG